jgi:CubicO group peptidase (beta-lactamase class C family)
VPYYKYQWWLPSRSGDFMAQGHLGQFIYVNPAKDLVIVRLGKNEGNINYWQLMTSLAAGY